MRPTVTVVAQLLFLFRSESHSAVRVCPPAFHSQLMDTRVTCKLRLSEHTMQCFKFLMGGFLSDLLHNVQQMLIILCILPVHFTAWATPENTTLSERSHSQQTICSAIPLHEMSRTTLWRQRADRWILRPGDLGGEWLL